MLLKKSIFGLLMLAGVSVFIQSCGTIANGLEKVNKNQRPVYLWNAPGDVVVESKGVALAVATSEYFKYKGTHNEKFDLPTFYLPYKEGDIEIKISSASLGKSATLVMKPKLFGWLALANCCLGPPVGFIVDYVTKNDRTMKPRIIDVAAMLNGQDKSTWGKP